MRPLLSVVVPVYNEEAWVERLIEGFTRELGRLDLSWELLVVDDGSVDRTPAIARANAARNDRIRFIERPHRGKGAAVRHGLTAAAGQWVFMADADLSMPPDNLPRFLEVVGREPVPHIVIGSREVSGAKRIGEPWSRHIIGRIFNGLVRLVAVRGINDTQCGYKLLSADTVAVIAPHLTIDGFAFDVELLYLARRAGFDVREVGITWRCRTETRVHLGRGAAAFLDVLRVRLNAWRGVYAGLLGRQPRDAPAPLEQATR